jgi:large repetitive protein
MRPAQIIATVLFTAALAVTGCTARATTHQTASPVSSSPPSVTPTDRTARPTGTTNPTVAIPVVSDDPAVAQAALHDAGLRVVRNSEPNANVAFGGVTRTSPVAGTSVARGATVHLFVSSGPARATCALSPKMGPAGSWTVLVCSGFAPSEHVAITFGAVVLTTTKATTGGDVASSFPVPDGWAGSHYPGRQDSFQAKGHQSGKVASATFTVTG